MKQNPTKCGLCKKVFSNCKCNKFVEVKNV